MHSRTGGLVSAGPLDLAQLLPSATQESLDRVLQSVPVELQQRAAWVAGDRTSKRLANGAAKSCKVPLNPCTGSRAKSNDPGTWATLDEACRFAQENPHCFGVGLMLLGSDLVCLDFDHVIDVDGGHLAAGARALLAELPASYVEESPSRTGLHVWFRGRLPEAVRGKTIPNAFGPGTQLEAYDGEGGGRYIATTGMIFEELAELASASESDLRPVLELQQRVRAGKSSGPVSGVAGRDHGSVRSVTDEKQPSRRRRYVDDREHDLDRARWGLLEAALLDPDLPYPEWFRVLATLKVIDPERGLLLAIEWSRRGDKFDQGEIERKWASIGGSSDACLFGMFDDADPTWRNRYEEARGTRGCVLGHGENGLEDPLLEQVAERKPLAGERFNGRLVLDPARTMPTADAYLREHQLHEDGRTFHTLAETFWAWNGSRYVEVEDASIRHVLQSWLHDAWTVAVRKGDENGEWRLEWTPFKSNSATIGSSVKAIADRAHLPGHTPVPSWIERHAEDPPAIDVLPCKSSLLHLPTRRTVAPTPRLFATNGIEFDYDPDASQPVVWLEFLEDLFGSDHEAVELLQEWAGYCLTGDTSQQKMLLVVGPKRSGKGTIARVLTELIGRRNVAGPTVSSLAGQFGLQPLIGKSLAVVSDARFKGEGVMTVVERLLCISGEDLLTVDRKHKESVTVKLGTRFAFFTNELPRFTDQSAALAGRFMILRLTRSFYGREDHGLTGRLLQELPGILNWALDGLDRLRERGRFAQPASSEEAVGELDRLSSPVRAFLSDRCVVGSGQRVDAPALYRAWQAWCREEGRERVGTKQALGRDLLAALPQVRCRQGTDHRFYDGVGLRP